MLEDADEGMVDEDSLPEYAPGELTKFLKGAIRGKYYDPNRSLVHVVTLDPDV